MRVEADINEICRRCLKKCKQTSNVRVVRCELYEPIPEQEELDLSSPGREDSGEPA